jgi:hypothetical protein
MRCSMITVLEPQGIHRKEWMVNNPSDSEAATPIPTLLPIILISEDQTPIRKYESNSILDTRLSKFMFSQMKLSVGRVMLDRFLFPSGGIYFGERGLVAQSLVVSVNRPHHSVIVHNNFMHDHANKIQRFKNTGLWWKDPSYEAEGRCKLACEHLQSRRPSKVGFVCAWPGFGFLMQASFQVVSCR